MSKPEATDKTAKSVVAEIKMRELAIETILGFVFWSLFEALAPMIWFYPLNELEISGYEVFAVAFLSPVIMGIGFLRRLVERWWVMALLRFIAVACLGSFQSPSTLSRLVILSLGVACIMLVFTASLWHRSPTNRCLSFWGLILGRFLMLAARIHFTSFVPTWWDNHSNTAVITVAMLATLDRIASGIDKQSAVERLPRISVNGLITGIGLGSLLYLTNALFGEVSLITRWTVNGYPDPGPAPWPYGAAVLIALWFGIVLSPCSHVALHPIWWLFGCKAFAALYLLDTWAAFAGGLVIAVYVMSVWPVMIDRATAGPAALTASTAVIVYVIEVLFSVWTVAYNFVPGGVYTREHTGWLAAFTMVAIGAALFLPTRRPEHKSQTAFVEGQSGKMPNVATSGLLFLLVLGGLGGFAMRWQKQHVTHPNIAHPRADFTAAIWTYHFGYDDRGWPSLERTAQLLNDTGADVITLLESDASKPFLGNNDLGMWLGEALGMYVDFGVSTRDHTWGNLLLSRYPFVSSRPLMLPSPHGELAPAIAATVNMSGLLVDFVVTHMGNDRDVLDRQLQAEVLAKELSNAENPVVFLGYVTSAPFSRDYKTLTEQGRVKDIDSTDTERWCEYIMYRGLQRLGYSRVSHGGLSDTEVQMARFRIPEHPDTTHDHAHMTSEPSDVPENQRFTDKFGTFRKGHNWAPKHRYHMSTPKYFLP